MDLIAQTELADEENFRFLFKTELSLWFLWGDRIVRYDLNSKQIKSLFQFDPIIRIDSDFGYGYSDSDYSVSTADKVYRLTLQGNELEIKERCKKSENDRLYWIDRNSVVCIDEHQVVNFPAAIYAYNIESKQKTQIAEVKDGIYRIETDGLGTLAVFDRSGTITVIRKAN